MTKMTNKKKLIIGLSVGVTMLSFITFVPYIINSQKSQVTSNNKPTDKQVSSTGYYVEDGFETIAKNIKPAIENYATENRQETAGDRKTRLNKYFTANSSVIDSQTQYISETIIKTTAKLTSLVGCDDQESTDVCAVATTDVTFYNKDGSNYTQSETYYILVNTQDDSSYKVAEIEPWKE